MLLTDLIASSHKIKLKITTITVVATFVPLLYLGLNHNKGRAKGPTHKNARTNVEVLKYHSDFLGLFRNSPHHRHFMASS